MSTFELAKYTMDIKKYFNRFGLQEWIFIIFSILWSGIIIMDYLNKQVVYLPSLQYFKYFGLFSFLGLLGALFSASVTRFKVFKKWPALPINGLAVFAMGMVIVCLVTLSYNQYWKAPLDFSNYLHLWGKGIFTLGGIFILVLSCYSVGSLFRSKLLSDTADNLTIKLIDLSLGFFIYTVLLFLYGLLGVLDQIVILGTLVILALLNYKVSFKFFMDTLIHRLTLPKDLKFWGALVLFFTLVFIAMNYMYTQSAYPLGFDARNYYVNIPKLISESEALVPGFQPYAWGLVMSTGYIAFNSPEITMLISVLGGILGCFAIYDLGKNYMGLSSNASFLIVLLFILTPTVTNHFIIEFKIDLALIFFQFVIINFLLFWIFKNQEANPQREISLLSNKNDRNSLIILGILLGYCLSIKVLSAFLIIGIFIALWWYKKDIIGTLGLSSLSIGAIFLSKLDAQSGLREYHLGATETGIALALLGLAGLAWSFIKSRQTFIHNVKSLVFCGTFILITFGPWIYKNYSFTKSTSIVKLIMGDKPRPDLNTRKIDQNYKRSLKNDN